MILTALQRRWLMLTFGLAAIGAAWALWHFIIVGDISPTYLERDPWESQTTLTTTM